MTTPEISIPARYVRAYRALGNVAKQYEHLGFPEAFVSALKELAPKLRPPTWCEYRRAAVLALQASGREADAQLVEALKQRESTAEPLPGRRHRRRTITLEEINTLIAAAKDNKDETSVAALRLGWKYGLRAAELPRLQVVPEGLFAASAKRTKNRGNNRLFSISEKDRPHIVRAVKLLKDHTSAAIRMRLYRLCQDVFPRRQFITLHRIRHQFASNLKASGVELEQLAGILGHRSCESTNAYGDPRRGTPGRRAPTVATEFAPRPVKRGPPKKSRGPAPGG